MATTGYIMHANADGGGLAGKNKLFYHDGIWWACVKETTDADFKLWKADGTIPSSHGDTGGWSKAALAATGDVEFADKSSHRGNIWMDRDGGYLHGFFIKNNSGTPEDEYNRFSYNAGTDDWDADVTEEVPSVPSSGSAYDGNHHTIVADTSNRAWIIYYDFGNNELRTKYRTIAGSWTQGPAIETGTAPGESVAALSPVQWKDDDGDDAIGVVYGWDSDWKFAWRKDSAAVGASWSSEIAYDPATVSEIGAIDDQLQACAYVSGVETTSRVCIAIKNGSANEVFAGVRNASGTWSTLVQPGNTANGQTEPSLAVDETNDEVYVFYVDSTGSSQTNLRYDKSDTGTLSFDGTDTTVIEDSTPTASKGFAGVPHHAVDSTMNLRVLNNFDGTNQGWNELSIAGGATVNPKGPLGHPLHGPLRGPVFARREE